MKEKEPKKHVGIAITGSIAAYKIPELVRLYVKEQHEVYVFLTPTAKKFVSELTLSVLSKNRSLSTLFDESSHQWHNHSELAQKLDLLIIAPSTACTLAKLARGLNDNIVTTIYLSSSAPVIIAPAMDAGMWLHPATQDNVNILRSRGNIILDTEYGELASGLISVGRMASPASIFDASKKYLIPSPPSQTKKVLINAGPTIEKIDPVRFISNFSSGLTGYALAQSFASRGYKVDLILGPNNLNIINSPHITIHNVLSAGDMHAATMKYAPESDIIICSAAVADYTPSRYNETKLKKSSQKTQLLLSPTRDILAELGQVKKNTQILVGFALESSKEERVASEKLKAKKADLMVFNSLANGPCFHDTHNTITIIDRLGHKFFYENESKEQLAERICEAVLNYKPKLSK